MPASLIGNWRQELARFAPTLRVFFAHRSECDAETLARVGRDPRGELADFDLVVTTYGLVRRLEWLAAAAGRWSCSTRPRRSRTPRRPKPAASRSCRPAAGSC